MFFLIAAALCLISLAKETSPPLLRSVPQSGAELNDGYKSAVDLVEHLLQMNDAEYRLFFRIGKICRDYYRVVPEPDGGVLANEAISLYLAKYNETLLNKKNLMDAKCRKLSQPAKAFLLKIYEYADKEMNEHRSQMKEIERKFYVFIHDIDACRNLLDIFPEFRKLGKCAQE
ncbi:unnamed protein product [Cylicocyclus nassatus]|uniref:Uncharacterized protein n=1 Tax=Cylicocyclus nassatus TaxID=53992 RepID=A0AA36DVU5_CYLNA|nr:unnamed protein product [Cylicocyclus nassatus]